MHIILLGYLTNDINLAIPRPNYNTFVVEILINLIIGKNSLKWSKIAIKREHLKYLGIVRKIWSTLCEL